MATQSELSPNQMVDRVCPDGVLRWAKYLGPHHNPNYAVIINHQCQKVSERWEQLRPVCTTDPHSAINCKTI